MRHSRLCLAAVFLLSSFMVAQHSSSSSGGSSNSAGGGGSHGGGSYSGGSSSGGGGGHSAGGGGGYGGGHSSGGGSNGGHSSGGGQVSSGGGSHVSNGGGSTATGSGSTLRGSSVHGTTARVSSSFTTARSEEQRDIRNSVIHGTREPVIGSHGRPVAPEKRNFFSFLRHPFRRPEPKPPVADLRRPVCLRGPCQVCPNGQIASKGGCGGTTTVTTGEIYPVCSPWGYWNNGFCVAAPRARDDCAGYEMMLQRQAEKLQTAELNRQSACTKSSPECSAADAAYHSELDLYNSLLARYQQCRQHLAGMWGYGPWSNSYRGYGSRAWNDPFMIHELWNAEW